MVSSSIAGENERLTQQGALLEIVQWSAGRPFWQRDALRRLVKAETLTSADIDELTAICVGEIPPGEFLQTNAVGEDPSSAKPVSLHSITACTGVNALAPEQGLTFQASGLTIIYGDNGSGKSGYVRVLAHACRTRFDVRLTCVSFVGRPVPAVCTAWKSTIDAYQFPNWRTTSRF